MKTNKILMAMVLAAGFTACTSEDVVESTQDALSNRKVLGNIEFTMGDVDSRFTQTKDGWVFDGGDAFGACLVDVYNGNENADAWKNYTLSPYIQTNYQYAKGEGNVWTTPARMVEGNYVFYAPFNAKHLARTAMETAFPINQTLDVVDGKVDPYSTINNAIKEGYPFFIDYKFLSATDQETSLSINFKHLYAYPEVKIVNDWEEDVTIEKIVIVTDAVNAKGTLMIADATATVASKTAGGIVGSLYNLGTETATTNEFGSWVNKDVVKGLAGATADVVSPKGTAATTHIVVEIPEGLTIKADDEVVFNVVMPAKKYDNLKIYAMVDDEEGFESDAIDATFHPGKRYPYGSYKADGSLKSNPGKTFSLTIKDEAEPKADAIAPIIVSTTAELVNAIKAVEEGSLKVLITSEDVVYNQSVADAIEDSDMDALTINGDITIEGVAAATTTVPNLPVKKTTINGKATIKNIVALAEGTKITEVAVASGADLTVNKNAEITKATNNGAMKIAGAATVTTLINKNALDVAAQLTGDISNYLYDENAAAVAYSGTTTVSGTYTTALNSLEGTWNVSGTMTIPAATLKGSMSVAAGGTLKGADLTVTGGTLEVNGNVENNIKLNGSPKVGDVAAVTAKVKANATSDFDGTITGSVAPEQNTLEIAEGAYFLKQVEMVAAANIKAIYTYTGNISTKDTYDAFAASVPVQANWVIISGNVMYNGETYSYTSRTFEVDGDVKGNAGTFEFTAGIVKIKNVKLEGSAEIDVTGNLDVTGSANLASGTDLNVEGYSTLKNLTTAKALTWSANTVTLTGTVKTVDASLTFAGPNILRNAVLELGTRSLISYNANNIHVEGNVTLAEGEIKNNNAAYAINLYNGSTLTIGENAVISGKENALVEFLPVNLDKKGGAAGDAATGKVVNNGTVKFAKEAYEKAPSNATADNGAKKIWWDGNTAWLGGTAPAAN